MIVDDHALVLRSMSRTLSRCATSVCALGGAAALEILAKDDAFDVVVCDLGMPDVDGVQVFRWLRAHAPKLMRRLVLCTGGPLNAEAKGLMEECGVRTVIKPVEVLALRSLIAEVSAP